LCTCFWWSGGSSKAGRVKFQGWVRQLGVQMRRLFQAEKDGEGKRVFWFQLWCEVIKWMDFYLASDFR
jgi:hypothetical protein